MLIRLFSLLSILKKEEKFLKIMIGMFIFSKKINMVKNIMLLGINIKKNMILQIPNNTTILLKIRK